MPSHCVLQAVLFLSETFLEVRCHSFRKLNKIDMHSVPSFLCFLSPMLGVQVPVNKYTVGKEEVQVSGLLTDSWVSNHSSKITTMKLFGKYLQTPNPISTSNECGCDQM